MLDTIMSICTALLFTPLLFYQLELLTVITRYKFSVQNRFWDTLKHYEIMFLCHTFVTCCLIITAAKLGKPMMYFAMDYQFFIMPYLNYNYLYFACPIYKTAQMFLERKLITFKFIGREWNLWNKPIQSFLWYLCTVNFMIQRVVYYYDFTFTRRKMVLMSSGTLLVLIVCFVKTFRDWKGYARKIKWEDLPIRYQYCLVYFLTWTPVWLTAVGFINFDERDAVLWIFLGSALNLFYLKRHPELSMCYIHYCRGMEMVPAAFYDPGWDDACYYD